MFGRNPDDIIVVNHDVALAIKVSFPRPQSSGSKYDSDVYGGQQYAPLLVADRAGLTPRLGWADPRRRALCAAAFPLKIGRGAA